MQVGGDWCFAPNPPPFVCAHDPDQIAATAPRRRIPISTPLTVSPPPTHPTSLPQSSLLDQAARAWRRSVCPPSGEGSAGATTRAWLVVHLCSRPCIDEGFSSAPLQNLSWRNRGYIVASHGTVPPAQIWSGAEVKLYSPHRCKACCKDARATHTRRGAYTALSTRGAYWAPPLACRLIEQAALKQIYVGVEDLWHGE